MLYSLVPFMFLLTSRSCLASLAPRAAVATWRPPLGGLATSDLRHEDVYTPDTSCIASWAVSDIHDGFTLPWRYNSVIWPLQRTYQQVIGDHNLHIQSESRADTCPQPSRACLKTFSGALVIFRFSKNPQNHRSVEKWIIISTRSNCRWKNKEGAIRCLLRIISEYCVWVLFIITVVHKRVRRFEFRHNWCQK